MQTNSNPEDGGDKFLWNVSNHLQQCLGSWPRNPNYTRKEN
jgi:hypothetical protein